MYKPVKLTKKTAQELMGRVCPRLSISKDDTPPEVVIFRASTGADGLEIKCENDWFNRNGRIRLTIGDRNGSCHITMYFHPDTLERDYGTEELEKGEEQRQANIQWVAELGKGRAHEMVDRFWDLAC